MKDNDMTCLPVEVSQDLGVFPPAVVPGQRLAERYEVGERIGGGGMADVFRARDRLLRRNVAVKVIRPHLASEDACRRMLREARATAAIEHPHILRVSDFGLIGTSAYIVTELLNGLSLSEVLKLTPEHRLDWRSALTLLLPALDALDRAHRGGLIHRDLKPDNLFVHRRDDREVLIVLDLGIAKVAPPLGGTGGTPATSTGRIIGTPAYMSPEQASGIPIDSRADIYSIGMTLYRMLAGCLPFESRPGDHAIMQMTRNIYDAPRPLDDDALRLPPGLSALVLQTLAKSPAERPPSMQALADALVPYLQDVPVVAALPLPPAPPQARGARLHRAGRLAMSAGVLAVLIALGQPLLAASDDPVLAQDPAEPRESRDEPRGSDIPSTLPGAVNTQTPAAIDRPVSSGLEVAEIPPAGPTTATEQSGPAPGAPSAASPAPPPSGRPEVRPSGRAQPRTPAALAQVLAGVTPEMQTCIAGRGGLDPRALRVHLSLGTDGQVTAATIPDPEYAGMLGKCALPKLLQLRFSAGPRQDLVHAFPVAVGGSR